MLEESRDNAAIGLVEHNCGGPDVALSVIDDCSVDVRVVDLIKLDAAFSTVVVCSVDVGLIAWVGLVVALSTAVVCSVDLGIIDWVGFGETALDTVV